MQKPNRLLLAVLALVGSSAALAQSSVTLYGRVNTSVERQKTGNTTTTALNNNASRFGFKGVEDLGGGLKAGFQLESGFDSTTGTAASTFFGRQSEVNLSGNFGMVRLGRWMAESYYAVADYGVLDEPNHDTGNASDALYAYASRDTNKVAYRTPDFGGLTVEGSASLHENAPLAGAGTAQKNVYDLAANWEGGALALGAGYTKADTSNQFGIRAHYTAGPFQIGGYFQRAEDIDTTGSYVVNAGKRNVYRLTGGYTFGASQVALGFGKAGKLGNVANSDAKQFIVGYNYNLSKRTKVYAIYTKVDNSAAAAYMTGTAGTDFSTYGVGIRHNF